MRGHSTTVVLAGHPGEGRDPSEDAHFRPIRGTISGFPVSGWIYIVTNKPHGVLYTGVTSDLAARVHQHRNGSGSKFASRYNCTRLVYAEEHERIEGAIAREKAIKEWPRLWKLRMIQETNPTWDDLAEQLLTLK